MLRRQLLGYTNVMTVVGIDEVGRGCWAGPLVAGAVCLKVPIKGLADSKKLSKKRREQLSALIKEQADWGLGWVEPFEVDELGLTKAVALAMQRAVDSLSGTYDEIIIDGNYNFLPHIPQAKAVIKADDSVPAVSAASIIAKVARDSFMETHAQIYPGYGFERHVGYGTAEHKAALVKLGPCELHRRSYKPVRAVTID